MSEMKTEPTPVERTKVGWIYTVKKGDYLMAIVKKEFNLKHPRNIQKVRRYMDLILAQNDIKDMNSLLVGDVLKLHLAEDDNSDGAEKINLQSDEAEWWSHSYFV